MEIITRKYKVFHFSELTEGAKEVAIQDYLNDGIRNDIFQEDCKNDIAYLFPNSRLSIQYSLGYCQGDGFNIYGSIDFDDILNLPDKAPELINKLIKRPVLTEKEIRTLRFYDSVVCDVIKIPCNRHYCYCLADQCDILNDWIWQLELSDIRAINEDLLERFCNYVTAIFTTLCRQYEKDGYKFLYEISNDEMDEICESNGWRFLADGSPFLMKEGDTCA